MKTNRQNIILLNAGDTKCEELNGQPDGRGRGQVQSPGNKSKANRCCRGRSPVGL